MTSCSHNNIPISVIAVGYNHANYARTCLDSIASQTCQDFELIICDDASSDDTVTVVDAWLEERNRQAVRITHKRNRGICATLNEALEIAQGRYLMLISLDDACLPDRLERHMEVLNAAPDTVAVVYSDVEVMDEQGRTIADSYLANFQYPAPQGYIFVELADVDFIPAPCTMIRTEAVRAIGGYDETLAYEDWDIFLRLAAMYQFAYSEPAAARYRKVTGSLSNTKHDESTVRLLLKAVGHDPKADENLLRNIVALSEKLYWENHPGAFEVLRARSHHDRSRRARLLSICASVRVPGRIVLRFLHIMNSLKRRANYRLRQREMSSQT